MDFLKKHYEKILLGLMLAGLIGVLVFMLFFIAKDTSEMEQKRANIINPTVHALTNMDLTALDDAAARAKMPYSLDLDTTNKVFNPQEWQKAMDGSLIPKAQKTGLMVAVVTNITPLYLIVSLDSIITNELGVRYVVQVERQAAPTIAKRGKTRLWLAMGEKPNPADPFTLLEVKGTPENPDGLVLKRVETAEVVTISKTKPHSWVEGYSADFKYDPEKKVFRGKRVGDKISFGGADYVVIGVNRNELILSDQSNQKNTSLPFVP